MQQEETLRIGELMLTKGLISPDQLRIALLEQSQSDFVLGQQLVRLGFVSEAIVRDLLAQQMQHDSIDLSNAAADSEALKQVPENFARRHQLLPLAYDETAQTMTVAMADVTNVVALDQLSALLGGDVQLNRLLVTEAQLETATDQFYEYTLSVDGILREIETGEVDYESLTLSSHEYTQPIVRLVDMLLIDAVKKGASDIHFEPEAAFVRIRYRIDGVLQQVRSLHQHYWLSIAVRLKVISGLNIAETRAAQDGRLNMHLCGRPIDFRVSTHPTIHGESIVLRILDREQSVMALSQMGLNNGVQVALKQLLSRPEGMLIVTGPTGSGKTTTLYSLLAGKNIEAVNIMTLEDPVEHPSPRMRQTSVSESNKVDFVNGIRSIMRQDPDIILVGEMRDEETAKMAFRAAMTGHQVLTTLHTNSALGVFARLADMGISHEMVAGNMMGVIAQRLVRVLCPHCKAATEPTDAEKALLALVTDDDVCIFKAQGCKQCALTGYRGRVAIMELLRIDDDLDALIARQAYVDELRNAAAKKGFTTLAQDGLQKVLEGTTSIEELMRVVDLTKHIDEKADL